MNTPANPNALPLFRRLDRPAGNGSINAGLLLAVRTQRDHTPAQINAASHKLRPRTLVGTCVPSPMVYTYVHTEQGGEPMQTAIAKVFTSGNSQAIRLPKEFRLDTNEVFITRSGDSLILTPRVTSWDGFAEGFAGFSDDYAVTGGLATDTPRKTLE